MPKQKGFTLIELSSVIMVVGVIVSAIVVGQVMMTKSRLMSVLTEVSQYKGVINSFYNKYNGYPGDIINASMLWCSATCPGSSNNIANCTTDVGTAGYCNGNGDGYIYWTGGVNNDESMRAWQHLYLANMLPVKYTGIHATAWDNIYNTNIPQSQVYPTAGYVFYHSGLFDPATIERNTLFFANFYTTTFSPVIAPPDAYAMDTKIDDGRPKTGNLRSQYSDDAAGLVGAGGAAGTSCAIGASNVYNYSTSAAFCSLQFIFSN